MVAVSKNENTETEDETAIVSLLGKKYSSTSEVDKYLSKLDETWAELDKGLPPHATLWIISENNYVDGGVIPTPHLIYKHVVGNSKWSLKNIIVAYTEPKEKENKIELLPAYVTILFFVKDRAYHFNKDRIRLPYVYQGREWGKRTHGSSGYHDGKKSLRYGGKGRDPGNVLYKEIREDSVEIKNILPISIEKLTEDIAQVAISNSGTLHTNVQILTELPSVKNIVKINL